MKGVMARVAWWKRGGVLVRDKGEGGPKRVTVVTERAVGKNCGLRNGVERCEG